MTAARRYFALRNVLLLGCSTVSVFLPSDLFASGEQGAWYDPSDLSTMFQNSAGTTPVTAVEQPVGLLLDKSKGGRQSLAVTGWAAEGSGDGTVTVVGNTITITGATTTTRVDLASPGWAIGNYADITVTGSVAGATGQTLFLGGAAPYSTLSGTNTFRNVIVSSTLLRLQISTGSATYIVTSRGYVPGNHASQSTSASRPVLKSTSKIDFDGNDDKWTGTVAGGGTTGFLLVAGINLDTISTNQTIWSDTGANTGYRVRINSSNQLELAAGNGSAYTTVTTTETVSAATNYVIAVWHDGTNLNAKLGLGGNVASQAFATASAGTTTFTVGMDNGAVISQLDGKVYNAVYVKNFAGSIAVVNNAIAYVNGKLT